MQQEKKAIIFIDGREGTTGLRIFDRLKDREDLYLIQLPEMQRKDPLYRKKALNECDIAFLCLPDAAAREAVSFVKNNKVKIIDASTAHRTEEGWVYGFPEISVETANLLSVANRVAVPGCHASGFIALVAPLIKNGLLSSDAKLCCTSITGYSGGGKKMIAQYETDKRGPLFNAPRQYALTQSHKHLKEMQAICGLVYAPIFTPIVADFYSGMLVTVPLFAKDLNCSVETLKSFYQEFYKGPLVTYCSKMDEDGFLSANLMSGKDSMQITVQGNSERILLQARFDNLGKGASGAAVQCMNLMLGKPMLSGLKI